MLLLWLQDKLCLVSLKYMMYWFIYTGVRVFSWKKAAPIQGLIELVELFLPLLGELLFLSKQFCARINWFFFFGEACTGLIICYFFYQNCTNYGRMTRTKRDSTPFPTHMASYSPIKWKLTDKREAIPSKWFIKWLITNKKFLYNLVQPISMF